jgi:Arc/MetJ-type ribon-helix-helix transcriptional regulator
MKQKPQKDRAVKTSISLQPEHAAFIEANLGLFGSTSGAVARGLEEMIGRIAEQPEAYTIKPVIPKAPKTKK